ncbi:MAG: hypothetical protein ABR552_09285 [Actinomycetota bacterium]
MKTLASLIAVMAMTLAFGPARAGDSTGAPCSDISDSDASSLVYRSSQAPVVDGVPATIPSDRVEVTMALDSASCSDVTYNVYALEEDTRVIVLGSDSMKGTGALSLPFRFSVAIPASSVCVYGTTVASNGSVLDRAPDAGCVSLTLDGPPSYFFH